MTDRQAGGVPTPCLFLRFPFLAFCLFFSSFLRFHVQSRFTTNTHARAHTHTKKERDEWIHAYGGGELDKRSNRTEGHGRMAVGFGLVDLLGFFLGSFVFLSLSLSLSLSHTHTHTHTTPPFSLVLFLSLATPLPALSLPIPLSHTHTHSPRSLPLPLTLSLPPFPLSLSTI